MAEKKYVIIAAGGFSTRMATSVPKQFLTLGGVPIIVRTIELFVKAWKGVEIIVVLPEDEFSRWEKIRKKFLKKTAVHITKGGATRFHSVKNGLKLIKEEGIVAVHDACRPLLSTQLLQNCLDAVLEKGNAVPAIDLKDSIREVLREGTRHRNRNKYKVIQTPQCFSTTDLKVAYKQDFTEDFTDDASVMEASGQKINLVEGDQLNFKITTAFDLDIAEKILSARLLHQLK